ncbi:hypothetical protein H257_14437 [Aphanomyces astaci]|uniref:Uncharacterized protein n=1 Tax=Aphanomyces astaci TaxID=112090 RepID=W4FTY7_APHAT|nr:hypothetical protein H257_14437 [Aphanomyces astaci]ETV70108.1 hypothetical protein H257_14437 [Aphanomyces astaci]|eukprot:XP_009840551.1 hypothetical protein H257_14437 [Aphanomyces astaci]
MRCVYAYYFEVTLHNLPVLQHYYVLVLILLLANNTNPPTTLDHRSLSSQRKRGHVSVDRMRSVLSLSCGQPVWWWRHDGTTRQERMGQRLRGRNALGRVDLEHALHEVHAMDPPATVDVHAAAFPDAFPKIRDDVELPGGDFVSVAPGGGEEAAHDEWLLVVSY